MSLTECNSLYFNQILDIFSHEYRSACIWLRYDKKILYLNHSAARMYGWNKKQVIGKNFSVLCHTQGIEDIYSKYVPQQNLDTPITKVFHELKLENQPASIIEWSFFPIQNKESKTVSVLMTGVDIRKNLQDENSYLFNIINNVPHTIFWKNRESVFLGCNKVFAQLAQLNSPEDIVGLTDYDLPWKRVESDAYRADDQAVMDADEPKLNIEETQTLADGRVIILSTSKVPLHDEQGRVNGVLGIYSDITEQKNTEKKLEKAKKDADELKRITYLLEGAKLISGSIGHEIRTPLATIKSAAWNIERTFSRWRSIGSDSSSRQELREIKKWVQIINKKVDQSNTIINMLSTKLQSVDFELPGFDLCSARECIEEAIHEFMVPEKMKDKINFKKGNDFKFIGNRTFIVHVIMNLLKNAIFYLQKAGKGSITIWLEPGESYNKIHFKDTGMGISKQILPYIFDSFFTTESSTGTGVGLAFSQMVMRSHKGEIDCSSVEGEYTEFILSFPKRADL